MGEEVDATLLDLLTDPDQPGWAKQYFDLNPLKLEHADDILRTYDTGASSSSLPEVRYVTEEEWLNPSLPDDPTLVILDRSSAQQSSSAKRRRTTDKAKSELTFQKEGGSTITILHEDGRGIMKSHLSKNATYSSGAIFKMVREVPRGTPGRTICRKKLVTGAVHQQLKLTTDEVTGRQRKMNNKDVANDETAWFYCVYVNPQVELLELLLAAKKDPGMVGAGIATSGRVGCGNHLITTGDAHIKGNLEVDGAIITSSIYHPYPCCCANERPLEAGDLVTVTDDGHLSLLVDASSSDCLVVVSASSSCGDDPGGQEKYAAVARIGREGVKVVGGPCSAGDILVTSGRHDGAACALVRTENDVADDYWRSSKPFARVAVDDDAAANGAVRLLLAELHPPNLAVELLTMQLSSSCTLNGHSPTQSPSPSSSASNVAELPLSRGGPSEDEVRADKILEILAQHQDESHHTVLDIRRRFNEGGDSPAVKDVNRALYDLEKRGLVRRPSHDGKPTWALDTQQQQQQPLMMSLGGS